MSISAQIGAPGPDPTFPPAGSCPPVDPRLQCAKGHFIDPAGCLRGCRPGDSYVKSDILEDIIYNCN